eukprot:6410166-Prymnesium_polylepis.1
MAATLMAEAVPLFSSRSSPFASDVPESERAEHVPAALPLSLKHTAAVVASIAAMLTSVVASPLTTKLPPL